MYLYGTRRRRTDIDDDCLSERPSCRANSAFLTKTLKREKLTKNVLLEPHITERNPVGILV